MAVAAGLERHLPGPAGRRLGRRRGPPGVPARPADPRAAHPPRQGDVQHLHRAGAAGRRRVDVRRLPRPRGPARDRAAHPPATPRVLAAALRAGGVDVPTTALLRHPHRRRCPGRAADVVAAARELGPAAAAGRRRPRRAHHLRAHAPARRSAACSRRSASRRRPRRVDARRRRAARGAAPHDAVPHPRGVQHATTARPQMLRYLRKLSARDYALDRGMIPLGSCTMKLNATTEMEPISLPGLRRPAPVRAGRGRRRLPPAGRRPRGLAGRGHRLRPGLDPAQRRLAGRARRAARDPRLPPRQRRRRTATSA